MPPSTSISWRESAGLSWTRSAALIRSPPHCLARTSLRRDVLVGRAQARRGDRLAAGEAGTEARVRVARADVGRKRFRLVAADFRDGRPAVRADVVAHGRDPLLVSWRIGGELESHDAGLCEECIGALR